MEEVNLSQGTVRYRDEGSGEPLVFAHGLLVNGRLWDGPVDVLRDRHRCIVPTLPLGSHTIPMKPDADLSAAGVARLLADLVEALDLKKVTLVGNDSGGAICQLVATRHPERVGRMVLTNCDTYDDFPPKLFSYLKVAARIPGALTATAQSLRLKPLRRSPLAYGVGDAGVRRDTRKFIRGMDPAETVRAAEDLERFAGPTLFAWGPEDRWFKIADAERLAESMPDARVERITDSKTFVPIDQPRRLAELIDSFVRETKPVAA
jgi:pimeloyl-ACP methyl ester carboxylesterase